MSAIEITRYERVCQRRCATWGEPELEEFKAKCQKRAEDADNNYDKNYYANLFNAIKDMSIDEVIEEYQKWRYEEGECILIDAGSYDVSLGEIIQDELNDAVEDAEAFEDSLDDYEDYVEISD